MKLSVSVPDGLWLACQLARPNSGPSEIIQEALMDWIKANPDYEELLTQAGKEFITRMLQQALDGK